MKKSLLFLILFLLLTVYSKAQDVSSRINTIKNQLEILKIETPGLEQTLDINITQTTLSNFLLAIAKVH